MKIIYVTASLPYGTTEVFAIPEVRELIDRGHEVRLVPMTSRTPVPHSDAEPFLPITEYASLLSRPVLGATPEVARAPLKAMSALSRVLKGQNNLVRRKNLGSFPKALWLARLARRWEADHIHAYWASVAATAAMIAGEVSGVPWSFTAHRWDIADAPNAFRAKLESARFARFISQDGLELARGIAGPQLEEKAAVIRMGVPLSEAEVQRTTPPDGVQLRLVCTGTLIPRKGQRFLLGAVARLKEQGIYVHVSFAGAGGQLGPLQGQAAALAITEQLTFLGNVDHNALLSQYAEGRYDAFILPSLHEGISVALIEAMSYGLPAIATDVGGTQELLNGGAGQLIAPSDVESIVRAVTELVRSEPARLEQGRRGRQRVRSEYDIRGVVNTLEAKFQAATHTTGSGSR